jgi:nucleotide-binding universal stress UspA family protein
MDLAEVMAVTQDAEARRWAHAPEPTNGAAPAIVVGLDGSPSSWDAFCWAVGEAVRIGAKLVAVYVIPFTEAPAAFDVPYDYAGVERARREVVDELRTEATYRAYELGVALSFVTERGDATRVLTEIARGLHANLVVVGRSAKRLHHLAGSLSHRLTSRNDAPVVVVVP